MSWANTPPISTPSTRDLGFRVLAGSTLPVGAPGRSSRSSGRTAGKATTVRMVCTPARPPGGRAAVAGFGVARQPRVVRRRIGLAFQEQTLDDRLTAEQNLRFHAVLTMCSAARSRSGWCGRCAWWAWRAGATTWCRRSRARWPAAGIARPAAHPAALLHEPAIGLDPQTRAATWDDLLRLRRESGLTVFLTTHYMGEAEYADRIAVIGYCQIVSTGTPDELSARWAPARSGSPPRTTRRPPAAWSRRDSRCGRGRTG